MTQPRTTNAGQLALIADEGEVLRAYKCPANVWTIGVGLTAASGVVAPKAGMVITKERSRELLAQALVRNYEPAVARAMPNAKPHEFDGGVSFHFNTGAISRATWVQRWRQGAAPSAIRAGLLAWNKGGGKVLRGLTLRREREADLILKGRYPHGIKAGPEAHVVVIPPSILRIGSRGEEVKNLQIQLQQLGLYTGKIDWDFGPQTEAAVRAFQNGHPHLTVDGIAGPATRAQLERLDNLKSTSAKTTVAGAGGGLAGEAAVHQASDAFPVAAGVPLAVAAVVMITVLGFFAWRYRDELVTRFKIWNNA